MEGSDLYNLCDEWQITGFMKYRMTGLINKLIKSNSSQTLVTIFLIT